MKSQYALPLALAPSIEAADYVVSESNRDAWRWVQAWPEWPANALLLTGPEASGKTHLATLWGARTQARMLDGATLKSEALPALDSPLVVEQIEHADAEALFHLLNAAREAKTPLLLTSRASAGQWPFTLPDLTSRLNALSTASLHAPDDELLAGVLAKQFADRQLQVTPDVISYIVPRMERSFAGAHRLVEALDRAALEQHRAVTLPLAREVLESVV